MDFFTSIGLEACVPKLRAFSIDGITLTKLDDADLRHELGIRSSILRKKVLANIERAIMSTRDAAGSAMAHATDALGAERPGSGERVMSGKTTGARSWGEGEDASSKTAGEGGSEAKLEAGVSHSSRVAANSDKPPPGGSKKGGSSSLPGTVFLSYTWKYQEQVSAVRDQLNKRGFSTWMDIQQLYGGDNLLAQIDRGIRDSDVVVSFVSAEYSRSDYCRKEVMLAENLHKPLLCVLVQPAPRIPWPPTGPSEGGKWWRRVRRQGVRVMRRRKGAG